MKPTVKYRTLRNDSFEDTRMSDKGWWGVDVDATVANYTKWRPDGSIGEPVERAVKYVKDRWLSKGKKVKMMTARVNPEGHSPEVIEQQHAFIYDWTGQVFGQHIEATYKKDLHMVAQLDDRAIQIYPNTGETLEERIENLENIIRYLVTLAPHLQRPINERVGYRLV